MYVQRYASDVKYMYTSVHGHIADCIELKWDIYSGKLVSYMPKN